jgi:hypothetical protein
MPNRILRDAILTSESVAALDWAAEVFYRRVMSVVDDYGRTEAGHQLLRAKCYPLQTDSVRVADIARWMAACQKSGLILVYGVNGKQYLEVCKFGQQVRSASKCPAPDSSCNQLLADAHLGVSGGVVVSEAEREAPPAASPAPKVAKEAKATRLPQGWTLPDPWRDWAKAERPEIDAALESKKFANYWWAKGGKDGRKVDWLATWRNWILGADLPRGSTAGAAPQARPIAGHSPEADESPEAKLREAHAFYSQEVREGRMAKEVATDLYAKVKAKYSAGAPA